MGGCDPVTDTPVLDFGFLPSLLGYQLRRAQVRLFDDFRRHFGAHGLTPGKVGLLVLIWKNPGLSQVELARAVGVERSTLGEALIGLEAAGWVARQPSKTDRRSKTLTLTAGGERFVAGLEQKIRAHEAAFLKKLGDSRAQALMSALAVLAEDA